MITANPPYPFSKGALQKRLNRLLDRVRPVGFVFHRPVSMFRLGGYIGYALGVFLAMALVIYRGLSPWVMLGAALMAALTFLGLAMATKIVTGEEVLVYYHHEIAILTLVGLFVALLGQPVLAYLDLTILGVGAFLMCGRMGCLMVGCCHGKPHSWGVCYTKEHAQAGVARYLIGVRLFPIQAVESLLVALVVLIGVLLVISGRPAGVVLAWYIVAYDLGRFTFEFKRGDTDRPYYGGFSEAQWISLFLTLGVVLAEWAGVLPFQAWHSVAAAGLILAMIGVTLYRRREPTVHQLLQPDHIREVAVALNRGNPGPAGETVAVQTTSLGIGISRGAIDDPDGQIRQFTFSFPGGEVDDRSVHALARLVMQLQHMTGESQLVGGRDNTFHLLIRPETNSQV